jgi:hypothetical protein
MIKEIPDIKPTREIQAVVIRERFMTLFEEVIIDTNISDPQGTIALVSFNHFVPESFILLGNKA